MTKHLTKLGDIERTQTMVAFQQFSAHDLEAMFGRGLEDENAKNAVGDMIAWLVREQGLSLHEAYAICSVAGDLVISEVVDVPNWIVSMTVPRGVLT